MLDTVDVCEADTVLENEFETVDDCELVTVLTTVDVAELDTVVEGVFDAEVEAVLVWVEDGVLCSHELSRS